MARHAPEPAQRGGSRLKPRALRGLVLALQLGSVRGAARALGISQPGLSKLLRELEAEFGAPLLVRSHRGVAATPAGTLVCEYSRRADGELALVRERIRSLPGAVR